MRFQDVDIEGEGGERGEVTFGEQKISLARFGPSRSRDRTCSATLIVSESAQHLEVLHEE